MAPLAYRNIFSTGRACYASMSGKHTVKIDVGAGGTEKRPLIHPRARTHTHSLFLLFSPPCCIDVPRISLSLSRWDVGIGKNVGDAGTCFDLPEKGLSSPSPSSREDTRRKERDGREASRSEKPHHSRQRIDDRKEDRKGRS